MNRRGDKGRANSGRRTDATHFRKDNVGFSIACGRRPAAAGDAQAPSAW